TQSNEEFLREALARINDRTYMSQEIEELSPNKIMIKVKTGLPSFLILSEVNYQGWRAYVDGVEVPIMSAYSVLRAIYIDTPGVHEVSFVYLPASFTIGVIVTLATPLVIIIVAKFGPRLQLPGRHGNRRRQFDESAHVRQCRQCGRQLQENNQFCD